MSTSEHVPADHILDDFLTERGIFTNYAEFSGFLKELRAAVVAEVVYEIDHNAATVADALAIARRIGGLS